MPETAPNSPLTTRRVLIAAALLGAATAVAYPVLRPGVEMTDGSLTVAQAHTRAQDGSLILIDIRRPDEWARTGIGEGAHPIDMRRRDFLTALQAVAGSDPARPIALICARGVRSARLARALRDAGLDQVIDVPEGMEGSAAGPGWVASGLPRRPFQG